MRAWIIGQRFATAGELDQIERNTRKSIEHIRTKVWKSFSRPIYNERQEVATIIEEIESQSVHKDALTKLRHRLLQKKSPFRRDNMEAVRDTLLLVHNEQHPAKQKLVQWRNKQFDLSQKRYGTHLYSQSAQAHAHVPEVKPVYTAVSIQLKGYEVLNRAFDAILQRDPRVIAFGEDVGQLGGVNQSMAGMQAKYGKLRVSDTGIREVTILGQAIGMALRGLRPFAEIQYLDYLPYALQIMSDDLATTQWRTYGGQKAPVIVRTRGHRLEGIWHAGSPMGAIINLLRGMYVLVPRNMVQAVGFYNTLLQTDEPALVIEVLNGYRLKETVPDNLTTFALPLGIPEVLREGDDITVVTYGAMVRIAQQTAQMLATVGIEVELIDVQSLLPFDVNGRILQSLQKTSRILFLDEDVPGGATAYMMQEVMEKQGGYGWLDSEPRTLTAQEHRPAYGSDGSYFSKPNSEDLFEAVYDIMNEADPARYPIFYR